MRKILFSLAITLGLLGSAHAEINITGTYSGEVVITASDFAEPLTQSENIIIEMGIGNFYTLKINQFTLLDPDNGDPIILIGDIEFAAVEATQQGENIVLSKAGISNGPVVYGMMPTTIELVSCVITPDGGMTVKLLVDAYLSLEDGAVWDINNIDPEQWIVMIDVTVDFTGLRQTSSVFSPKAETIAIYPTIVDEVITVVGFETENYAIYALNGALVKAGKVNGSNINVANLETGVYFLNINGASAKFSKK